ncbi:MAG TPA: DUF438 domain-containing protein [Sedimentisphaerales bacterium]|nr:DUF438 domain-containing protein [Sedimentisphaerales bacterium]
MAILPESSRARTLTRLLRRINSGDNPDALREEAHRLLPMVDPRDIAAAEQNLVDGGYTLQQVQLLSAMFMLMGIAEEQCIDVRMLLPANHLVRVVMAEHEVMRCFLADLKDVVEEIGLQDHLSDVSLEFRRLWHVVGHLTMMEEHIEREDDVIFPWLKRYGRISLCCAMQSDHIKIRTEIDNLGSLLVLFNEVKFEQFKAGLASASGRLLALVPEHLSQEDDILYPIALGIVDDPTVWVKMKAVCDQIGYCGVHP